MAKQRSLWHFLARSEQRRSRELLKYIERSVDSQVYFDALLGILYVLLVWDEKIPPRLAAWWAEFDDGRRIRPPLASIPFHRPVNSAHLVRDFHICFVIEILRRVRVPPRGTLVSGCEIVSTVLGISEENVERIWNGRMWEKSPEPALRKHLEAISDRTGLAYDADV